MIKPGISRQRIKAFSVMKVFLALIAILVILIGLINSGLQIYLLFLVASFTFVLSATESYILKRWDPNFNVDVILAISFLVAYFLVR
ncbi:hypothetical protein [Neobacillus sp. NPDC093127]|uniref:hypothetical protein n=1 Tax=Neobacillus sp. NPDC093127 TaxID=3364296 RepID=UPI0038058787